MQDSARRIPGLLAAAAALWIAVYWLAGPGEPGITLDTSLPALEASDQSDALALPEAPLMPAASKPEPATPASPQPSEPARPPTPGPVELNQATGTAPATGVSGAGGQNPGTEKPAPVVYHDVRPGDSLARIARTYYGDESQAMRIFEANREIIRDPARLQVGWRLRIPQP